MLGRFTKKRAVVALGAIGALALAGVAIAYFTSQGSGSGTATVGQSQNVTVSPVVTGDLYPLTSAPSSNVSITVSNPSGGGNEQVNTVYPDGAYGAGSNGTTGGNGITIDSTHATAGCQSSWFEFDGDHGTSGGPVSVNQDVPSGSSSTAVQGTLWLVDSSSTDQSSCEGATVTLHMKSN